MAPGNKRENSGTKRKSPCPDPSMLAQGAARNSGIIGMIVTTRCRRAARSCGGSQEPRARPWRETGGRAWERCSWTSIRLDPPSPPAREPRGAAAASGPGGRRRNREKSLPQENLEDAVTTLRPTLREDQELDQQERVCTETRSRLSSTTRINRPRQKTPARPLDPNAARLHPMVRGRTRVSGIQLDQTVSTHLHAQLWDQ